MKFSIRLAQILGGRRGAIRELSKATGLERHTIADLYRNRARYISLRSLAAICDYLLNKGLVADASQLPGILFAQEPDEFWSKLACCTHLDLAIGVRSWPGWPPEQRFVAGSDSLLLGAVLAAISLRPGTPSKQQAVVQHLVAAPSKEGDSSEGCREAQGVFADYLARSEPRALICLGSTKSNPVSEVVLANTFVGCEPFVASHSRRSPIWHGSPLYFRYRSIDPGPPSCCGGYGAPGPIHRESTKGPGLYYLGADGKWICCPFDEELRQDSAVLVYTYRPPWGRLEVVLAGFTWRGTEALAERLKTLDTELLKPAVHTDEIEAGALVIKFRYETSLRPKTRAWRVSECEPIVLGSEVLAKRIAPR